MVRIERHAKCFRIRNAGAVSPWTTDGQTVSMGEYLTDGKKIYVECDPRVTSKSVRLMLEIPTKDGCYPVCREKVFYVRRGDRHILFVGEDSSTGSIEQSLELHGFKVDVGVGEITKEVVDVKA